MTIEDSSSDFQISFWQSEIDRCLQSDNDESEAEGDVDGVSLSPNRNKTKLSPRRPSRSSGPNRGRKRKSVSGNLQKAGGESRKKGRCSTVYIGESSASQQPEPEGRKMSFEERMENSFPNAIKVLKDKVYRRINNMPDVKNLKVVSSVASVDLDLIQHQWPVRSALENIQKEIKEIEGTGTEVTDELKKRLLDIEGKIKKLDKQRQEDSRKVKDLEKHFTNEGVSAEMQREKLSAAFPWLFQGEVDTNSPSADQDQGRWPTTREQLLKEIVAENNNEVDVTDFPNLKEAIEKTTDGWNVPDYLKPVVIRIEKDRGKATDSAHFTIQLLVCAVIQEMEDIPLEGLDWPTLLRWGAVLTKAVQLDFSVKFAENLFWKNVFAFFAFSNIE